MKLKSLLFSIVGFFAIAAILSTGCSKEIDINANWKDITVVFGLLDQKESVHYVKINKAFLGEEDAFVMASVRDSSEYENLEAKLEAYKDGNPTGAIYNLVATTLTNREEGDFYYPDHTVYSFTEPNLDVSASYKLTVKVNAGKPNEKVVTAQTELIDYIDIIKTGSDNKIAMAAGSEFRDPTVKVLQGIDGKRYEAYLEFNYTEIVQNSSNEDDTTHWYQTLTMKIKDFTSDNSQVVKEAEVSLIGKDFYRRIGEFVPKLAPASDPYPKVVKRVVEDLGMLVVAGGEDLNTYLEVNEPTVGIVQEKQEYTNIENGIGLFSCRTSVRKYYQLDVASINELMFGEISSTQTDNETGEGYTIGRGFCNNYVGINDPNSCWK